MRTLATLVLLALTVTAAETYTIRRVRRVDADLYRGGNVYFKTRYCYHYTNSEDVILEWDGRRGKVVWANDTTCQVVDVFRK